MSSEVRLFLISQDKDSLIWCQSSELSGSLAKTRAMQSVASGKPQHFFIISSETSFSCSEHSSLEPKAQLKSNSLVSFLLSGSIVNIPSD